MLDGMKNLFAYLERSRAKTKEHENPPERTPFQKWSDEYRALTEKVEHALRAKPQSGSLATLKHELLDFKERWNKHLDGRFSSQAVVNVDALIQRVASADEKTREQD